MEAVKVNENSGLLEAIRYFSDPLVCLEAVSKAKWPKGPECPRCQSKRLSFLRTRLTWTCLACRKQFSVKVGTIFEDSPIVLDKWLCAMWMLANCKNGVTSYEIGRALHVTQKTAWFMLHRIRYAQHNGSINKITGTVEADETFIGGKARNMHHGNAPRRFTVAVLTEKPSSSVCWIGKPERSAHRLSAHAESSIFTGRFARMSRPVRRCTPMP